MNIKKINLNLLVSFNSLITECSVSNAAKKCHVTQAAMSNTLHQLRELFNDPLFIRESKGIKPTPKALSLHGKIRDALASIEDVFTEEFFDPKLSKREFHLALSEHGENLLLPHLYKYISTFAPSIKLRISPYRESINDIERLSTEIDIAIGSDYGISPQVYSEKLMLENGIIIMNKRHIYANKLMTMKSYLSLKHIAVTYNAGSSISYIDASLKKLHHSRNVIMYLTNIRTAVELVRNSDLVGTFPKALTLSLIKKDDFVIKKMPFHIDDYRISLLYHKRYSTEPAHAWLVSVIKKIVQSNVNG